MTDEKVPDDLRYTKSHEWVRVEGDVATVGITDHAQSELTDIVFVDPAAQGKSVAAGGSVLVLESVKTVADVYAPGPGTVTEVDPVRAVEARMDGFRVMPMLDAVRTADLIVTVTGNTRIVREEHFRVLKDGCLLANSGHFDVEVSRADLEGLAVSHRTVRPQVEEYRFADGRRTYLLGEGRLVNLAAGQGHPVEIMDLSFALQALSAEHLAKHGRSMEPRVHAVPPAIDHAVALAALPSLGARIDELTKAQRDYERAWEGGT